jgi:N-acetylglucosamine kinase-like BadF-type ATPase
LIDKKYVLGVDGGGTKTAFELADLYGNPLAFHIGQGTSYLQHGFEKVLTTLKEGRDRCIDDLGISLQNVAAICIGLPAYEEFPEKDKVFVPLIREALKPAKVLITNDTEVAWAGSLGCMPGINVVAGTGSISFGCNEQNEKARCGGWSSVFGDEGSAYWAGIKAMELFTKQADGRKPKGALYTLVRKALSLTDDIEFIAFMHEEYLPYRDKVASFQMLLNQAALLGDAEARNIYLMAADELALLVKGTLEQLYFNEGFSVSYSGGMFKAGDLILPEFNKRVQALGGRLIPPMHNPVHGAVLMALSEL